MVPSRIVYGNSMQWNAEWWCSYLELYMCLRPRQGYRDVEEDIPELVGGGELEVLEGGASVAELDDEELGAVKVPARGGVEL